MDTNILNVTRCVNDKLYKSPFEVGSSSTYYINYSVLHNAGIEMNG